MNAGKPITPMIRTHFGNPLNISWLPTSTILRRTRFSSASSSGVFSLPIRPRHGRETNRAGRTRVRIGHGGAVEGHLRLGPATEAAAIGRELRPVRALAARHPAIAVRTELAGHRDSSA